MTKVLRKHGKWILAGAGILLMLAWVVPTGSKSGNEHAGSVVRGTLAGKKVLNQDFYRAGNTITLLRTLGGQAGQYNPTGMAIGQLLGMLDPRDPNMHLYLLLTEAHKYGIAATKDEVAAQIANLSMSEADLRAFLSQHQARPRMLEAAMADMIIVQKLTNFAIGSLLPSEPELYYTAQQSMARVKVDYAVFDANKPSDKIGEPSAEQIQKHFDAYKNVLAGQSPDHFPFGYKYPDRVKIEYLTFTRRTVRASLKPTREDVIAASEFYRANLDRFTEEPPAATQSATSKPADTQASTQPRVKTFEEVRTELIEAQMSRRVDDLLRKLTREATTLAAEAYRSADGSGGNTTLPADKLVKYERITDELQKRYNVRVTYYAPGPWLSREDLAKYPGVGDSWVLVQNQPVANFATAATSVSELSPASPPQILKNTHIGNELPTLMDPEGNMYVARVVTADKTHVPPSVDEIKDQVVQDLKKLMTYERYLKDAQKIATDAQSKGLEAIAGKQKVVTSPLFSRETPVIRQTYMGPQETGQFEMTNLPGIGRVPEFMDAAFSLLQLPDTLKYKTAATGSPEKLSAYVLELRDSQPVTADMVQNQQIRMRLASDARMASIRKFVTQWRGLEAAAQRVNFVPTGGFRETSDE